MARAWQTLEALTAACLAADGPEAIGYEDMPLDPFAPDCLPTWREVLDRIDSQ